MSVNSCETICNSDENELECKTLNCLCASDIIFLFDFDLTLFKTNTKKERKVNYMEIIECEPLDLYDLFLQLKEQFDVRIVTGRHSSLRNQIAEIVGIDKEHVLCRTFANEPEEYKSIISSKENEEKFIKEVKSFKVLVCNEYSKYYKKVIFIDDTDFSDEFQDNEAIQWLNPNSQCMLVQV